MLKLTKYLMKFKKETIIGPIFKLLEAIFELIVPLVMAKIIDVGIKNNDVPYILKMGGIMLLLGFFGLIFALICQYCAARASQGFGTVLRNELFTRFNSYSFAELDKLSSSSLITRLTNDVNQLQLAVAMLIRLVVRAPFLVIGAMVMAFSIDAKISIIFCIAIVIIAILLYIVMFKSIPFYKRIQKLMDKLTLISRENLSGARVIRALAAQKKETSRFEENNNDIYVATTFVGKISALLNPLTFLVLNFAIIAILWFGGIAVNNGNLTQGEIIALVNYMTQILLAVVVVANLVIIFTRAQTSAIRVNELLAIKSSMSYTSTEAKFDEDFDTAVEFKNVSFSYENGDKNAIKNISFTAKKGQTIGIIGGTGCGKSTLVNLIPRFYDVSTGEVLVNGVDVKQIQPEILSSLIGVVSQHKSILSGTVRDNLLMSRKNVSEQDIWEALRIAQADDFISGLAKGLDHKIEQNGQNLSGGQFQRLTIARALISHPKIVILDDSSSALDYKTDLNLRRALKNNLKCTTFIVSQRINSIKDADIIMVLDDGELIASGNHSELFASCELYNEICVSQLSSDELELIKTEVGANNG